MMILKIYNRLSEQKLNAKCHHDKNGHIDINITPAAMNHFAIHAPVHPSRW